MSSNPAAGLFAASVLINQATERNNEMSVDDLVKKPEITEQVPKTVKEDEKKEEGKGHPGRLMIIAAVVAAGAIFLAKKFKGKLQVVDKPGLAP